MKSTFVQRQKRSRLLKRLLLSWILRNAPADLSREKLIVTVVGDYIGDKIRTDGLYEREFLEPLRDHILKSAQALAQTALDVGANVGNHSLFLSDLFKSVIAFEPNPFARRLLEVNVELNGARNIDIRPVGLSDRNAEVDFTFSHQNLGGGTAEVDAEDASNRTTVTLAVGDEVIDPVEPVGFLKVDVEGAEESVLRGLRSTIESHYPIIMMEQWADVIDSSNGSSPSFALLQELGYSAWELSPLPLFRGRKGKIAALLLGRTASWLVPVHRLSKRDYRALFFTPPSYVFPQQS